MVSSDKMTIKKAIMRVPAVTLIFWIIKTLSTTVGETGADFLATGLKLGMPLTTSLAVSVMAILFYLQFSHFKRYVVANYWALVVLMSVIGTLVTDMLVDLAGVPLGILSLAFTLLMLGGFYIWYRQEGTLSIHSIDTGRREFYYWVVILLAFALGTGLGDLISEHFALGYNKALFLFAALIAVVTFTYFIFKLNAVTAFWLAYVLTRPLGASLGDYLIQAPADGGLGFSMTTVNFVFLSAIIVLCFIEWLRCRKPVLSGRQEEHVQVRM